MAFAGRFFLRDKAGSPERTRLLHLARSGSQSHRAIWFILPARGASHIIKCVVIPPNSNTFPDWWRTCHVPLVKTQ